MSDRRRLDLPVEFAREIADVGLRVDAALPVDFAEASRVASEEFDLIQVAEAATGRDLHKGHPLYNIGVTLYPRDRRAALRHFKAAFVEDARTYEAPRQHLAARVIRTLFKVPGRLLDGLVQRAFLDVAADPRLVADQIDFVDDATLRESLFPEDEPDDWLLDVRASDLVFVGGSYGRAGDRIFQIADQVAACGLHPVIVGLLRRRPGESDRQKSFRILDLCGLAAFDGSVQERPGWWAEIERILQTSRIPTLVAFFSSRGEREYRTSAMFPSERDHPELVTRPFGRNLEAVVRSWILEVHAGPTACNEGNDPGGPYPTRMVGSNTPYLTRLRPSGSPFGAPRRTSGLMGGLPRTATSARPNYYPSKHLTGRFLGP